MKAFLALSLLLLAACGTRGPLLRLQSYDQVPPERLRELRRTEGAAAAQALVPPPEAAPKRKDNVDDGILPRGQDPFDLPPAGRRVGPVASDGPAGGTDGDADRTRPTPPPSPAPKR